ncbi:MAG: hypothetical protein Cons2KO_05500 [Congregibacter sp.]
MSQGEQQRYNLIFSGQLFPDTDRAEAERALAAFFGIDDPVGIRPFFSGRPVPLRRNLPRADVLRIYRQLRTQGQICDVVESEVAAAPAAPKAESTSAPPEQSTPESSPTKAATTHVATPETRPDKPPAEEALGGKAPNLFALRPAFSPDLALNRESATLRALICGAVGLALLIVAILVFVQLPKCPPGPEPKGPLAIAAFSSRELLVMTEGSLLHHERSGLPKARYAAEDFGLARFAPPLHIEPSGTLILNAQTLNTETLNSRAVHGDLVLQRCDIESLSCFVLSANSARIASIAQSTLGDTLFLLTDDGRLLRADRSASITEERKLLPAWGVPRVLARDGLLYTPASDAPLLGVYRPDAESFGQQLDALLLMPSTEDVAVDRIRDIAISSSDRWALMGGEAAPVKLFRFDQSWGNSQRQELPEPLTRAYLSIWRDSLLVADPQSLVVRRFADGGTREADFVSSMLRDEQESWLAINRQRKVLRQYGLVLPLCSALALLMIGGLYALSSRSIGSDARKTDLLDPMPAGVNWSASNQRLPTGVSRAVLTAVVPVLCAAIALLLRDGGQSVLCMLPALAGAMLAIRKVRAGVGGQFGLAANRIILVDTEGRYFYGPATAVRRQSGFLISPQIVVPINLLGLGNLTAKSIECAEALPLKSERSNPIETIGHLWRLRHPWIIGVLYLLGGWLASLACLLLYSS